MRNSSSSSSPSSRFQNLLGYDPALERQLKAHEKAPQTFIIDPSQLNQSVTSIPGSRPTLNNTTAHSNCKTTTTAPLYQNSTSPPSLEKRFINPPDSRYLNNDTTYPFNLVGKLSWSNGVFCSGALIGPRHALTAKHCWIDDPSVTATFSPNFNGSVSNTTGSATVLAGFMPPIEWGTPCGFKGDWAILILDQRLGQRNGYFGVRQASNSSEFVEQEIFTHVGYPGDLDGGSRPYRVDGNPIYENPPGRTQFDCDEFGPFYTDTDCMGGQSGGPIWEMDGDDAFIWGTLAVTGVNDGTAWSGWGSGDEMLGAIDFALSEFP